MLSIEGDPTILPRACIKVYTDEIGLSYLRIVLFIH